MSGSVVVCGRRCDPSTSFRAGRRQTATLPVFFARFAESPSRILRLRSFRKVRKEHRELRQGNQVRWRKPAKSAKI